MKLDKIFLSTALAIASAAFTGCSDEDYWTNGAPSGESVTAEGSAASNTTLSFPFEQQVPENPLFTLELRRGSTSGALTVALSATAKSDADLACWDVPASVTFADGQNSVLIPVSLNAPELKYTTMQVPDPTEEDPDHTKEVEGYFNVASKDKTYTLDLSVKDADLVGLGGVKGWTLTVSFQASTPDPVWKSMGKGTYVDKFFFSKTYQVEVLKDEAPYRPEHLGYYGHYKLVTPYKEGFQNTEDDEDAPAGSVIDNDVEFYILGPKTEYPGALWEQTTPDGMPKMVYFASYNTGYLNGSDGFIWAYNGVDASNLFDMKDAFSGQIVLGWKTEPKQESDGSWTPGEPGAVSLGAFMGLPGSLDKSSPNVGRYYANYLADSKSIQFIFPGYSLGFYGFSMQYDGQYANKDDKEFIEVTFDFFEGHEEEGEEGTEIVVDQVSKATKVICGAVLGDDLSWAAKVVSNSMLPEEKRDPEVDVVPLITVNNPGGKKPQGTARIPVSDSGIYYVVAYSIDEDGKTAENAAIRVKFTSLADMGGDPEWKMIGAGSFYDNLLGGYFYEIPAEDLTYAVPVYESILTAGVYRVDAYNPDYYPYLLSDFTVGEPVIFDTTNPDCVKTPSFECGYVDGFGTLYFVSIASYFAEQGAPDSYIISKGYGGVLKDGVITYTGSQFGWASPDNVNPKYQEGLWVPNTYDLNCALALPGSAEAKAKTTVKSSAAKIKATKRTGKINAYRFNSPASFTRSVPKGEKKAKEFRVPMLPR